ncbi:PREDICTED: glycoprotein 3-alpha-L-fucosyltransferase A-like, partial [Rhagoletis zephyria]|uniref:glycoprotein 3-alpha-L-fucosyltransferase A-like n=1 Tax=Rhagoletis zephyria TaxID=28612 RepID=UPI0008116C87
GNWGDAGLKLGQGRFLDDHCPVSSCSLVDDVEAISEVDAVIFKDRFSWPRFGRPLGQLWILFLLEGPRHTQLFSSIQENTFNWTATYRHDSDLVTPYEKFVTYESLYGGGGDEGDDEGDSMPENVDLFRSVMLSDGGDNNVVKPRNYAEGKTKKVAIFISNCAAQNKRLEYTRELSKHIEVDIYGNCGKLKCPRSKPEECFAMLNRDYKFYLAFENSNCRDYITEKFFVNSLGHNSDSLNIVPVVMGGSQEDYRRSAPAHSFIHVDDFRSPALLARYLSYLDGNDTAYSEFFDWKSFDRGPRTGEFINTYFWCRLCALLHAPPVHRKSTVSYKSMAQWWAPKGVCLKGFSRWPE